MGVHVVPVGGGVDNQPCRRGMTSQRSAWRLQSDTSAKPFVDGVFQCSSVGTSQPVPHDAVHHANRKKTGPMLRPFANTFLLVVAFMLMGHAAQAFSVSCGDRSSSGTNGTQTTLYIGSDPDAVAIGNPNCSTSPRATPGFRIRVTVGGSGNRTTTVSVVRQNAAPGAASLVCAGGTSGGTDTIVFNTPDSSNVSGTCSASFADAGKTYDLTFFFIGIRSANLFGNTAAEADIRFAEMVVTTDLIPPTPAIEYLGYDLADPFTVRITWDEPVTGFEISDLVAPFADLSNFQEVTPGLVYTVTAQAFDLTTPPEVSIPAGVAEDLAGNPSLAAPSAVLPPPDGIAPVLTISGLPDGFTGPTTATITFDWGERVLGFQDSDITVTGGTLGPISGGPDVWTAELTVTGDTDVSVTVADGAVIDASGTPSRAASATGAYASDQIAEELIREFLGARARSLIGAQPSLTALLDGGAPSGNVLVTRGAGLVQLRSGSSGPVWAALDAQWSDLDGFRTSYTHLTFGGHMTLAPDQLLGVMLQLDHAASTEGVAEISGTGWLIGPYYVGRFEGIDVDARLLWGRTDNRISPLGTYTDSFGGERMLAMLNVSGEVAAGRATLRPLLGWAYVDERSEAYVDALSNPVAAQRVRLSELEAALDWTIPVGEGAVELVGGVSGIYASEQGGNSSLEGMRGRIDLGLRQRGDGPVAFDVGLWLDGLGEPGFEAYGIDLSLDIRF